MKKPELTKQLITSILEANDFVISQCDFDEDQIADVAECYLEKDPDDGYEFMWSLSRSPYHWEGDFSTSENLEAIIYEIKKGYYSAIAKWVQENNIEPKYKAGDEVENTDYVILDIDKYRPFTYKVQFKKGFPKAGSSSYINLWFDQIEHEGA